MKHIRTGLFSLLLVCLFLLVGPAAAQDDDPPAETPAGITLAITAGMDTYYKGESWVPVHVNVANSGPSLEGSLRLRFGSGQEEQTYTAPLSLPTQSNKRVTLYVTMTSYISRLTVQLLDDNGDEIGRATTPTLSRLEQNDLLYGVLSPNGGELGYLEDVTGGRANAQVALLTLDDLPSAAAGWDMLDVLIVHDTDMSELTTGQQTALDTWLSLGGYLVVAGGTGWQKTMTPLADYLPVTVTGSEAVADLPGLRNRLGPEFQEPGPYLVTTSSLRSGELLIHEDGQPLLAEREWGRGRVFFLALDPTLAPLADWDGTPFLWAEIVSDIPRLPFWAGRFTNFYAASEAVKNIPSLALPSALLLICFMSIYVVLIGPANYLVLKRLKRRELAWISIPAVILFFTICAYFTGFGLKGNNLILHQMNIAYGQVNSPALRVNSLVALYSPRRATYDLILPAEVMALPFSQDFNAGFVATGNVATIERGTDLILRDVRVDVSDSQTFMTESYQPAPSFSSEVRLLTQGSGFQLHVTVRNEGDVTLENAVLLYGTDIHPVGKLEPGDEATWTLSLSASEVSSTSSSVYGGYTSPLLNNDQYLLGTTSYYSDPVAYSRRQLLEAMHQDIYYSSGSTSSYVPRGVVTLIGWTDEQLLDLAVDTRRGQDELATTLYFLELPMTEMQVSGRNITVPTAMLAWEVLESTGQYGGIGIQGVTLYNGEVTYQFQPGPEMAGMNVNTLNLLITRETYGSNNLPRIRIWNWTTETWDVLDISTWGMFKIAEPENYLDASNRLRLQLENNGVDSISIRNFYPIFSGDVE